MKKMFLFKLLNNKFDEFKYISNKNDNKSWQTLFKIGFSCIFIGCLVYMLKEIIIGFISLIFICLGIYILILSYKIWISNY